MKVIKVKRGQVYYADLSPVVGSEQGGIRPVLVIQNDIGNTHSPTTIIACITSKLTKHNIPTHIDLPLFKDSIILCEQLRTIDKRRLRNLIGEVSADTMEAVNKAIKISLEV